MHVCYKCMCLHGCMLELYVSTWMYMLEMYAWGEHLEKRMQGVKFAKILANEVTHAERITDKFSSKRHYCPLVSALSLCSPERDGSTLSCLLYRTSWHPPQWFLQALVKIQAPTRRAATTNTTGASNSWMCSPGHLQCWWADPGD